GPPPVLSQRRLTVVKTLHQPWNATFEPAADVRFQRLRADRSLRRRSDRTAKSLCHKGSHRFVQGGSGGVRTRGPRSTHRTGPPPVVKIQPDPLRPPGAG